MLSSRDFENFRNLDSDQLLAQLKIPNNNLVWECIYNTAVLSVLKGTHDSSGRYVRNNFHAILQERGIDASEILSDLYNEVIVRDKIKLFEQRTGHRSSLIHWLKIYVRMLIRKYCQKNTEEVSESVMQYFSVDKRQRNECAEVCRMSFSEVWKDNPMRAYVLMLKDQKYSSGEICQMLGLASANYVDQVYLRAKKDMAKQVNIIAGGAI